MCGRYTLARQAEMLADHFDVPAADWPDTGPRYNVSPTQTLPIVRLNPDGRREVATAKWGLIPSWAKAPSTGYSTINAKCETVQESPAYRGPFRKRRCLIPGDGFFEWVRRDAVVVIV